MEKPVYISTQRFYLLDAVTDPARYLEPARFRAVREYFQSLRESKDLGETSDQQLVQQAGLDNQDAQKWNQIDRRELLLSGQFQRLVVSTDGGVGKSTTLKFVEQQLGREKSERLGIYVEFKDLPESAEYFLKPDGNGSPGSLITCVREKLKTKSGKWKDDQIRAWLVRLIRNGQLVLLADGLDQTGIAADQSENPRVKALATFLKTEGALCQAMIGGRPHAIGHYWNIIFRDGDWRFAQIDHFTQEETETYLGTERTEKLKKLDVETLSIPRMLKAIKQLDIDLLNSLNNASDLYHEAIEFMFRKEQDVDNKDPIDQNRTIKILALLAFEIFRAQKFQTADGVPEGTEFEALIKKLEKKSRRKEMGWSNEEDIKRDLNRIAQQNAVLDYSFLYSKRQMTEVYFRDTTLHEFFAAIWLTRYSDKVDWKLMSDWPFIPRVESLSTEHLTRIWRFASEMPEQHRRPKSWVGAFATQFQHKEKGRPSEILFRCWQTMEAYASEVPKAKKTLKDFQSEFSSILFSEDPELAEQKLVAIEFMDSFVPIPPDDSWSLEFIMGSSEAEQRRFHSGGPTQRDAKIKNRLELSKYLITNQIFELFDSSRRERRSLYSQENLNPAVLISWFDSSVFCRWLGQINWKETSYRFRLPHEVEWEYSCRAGSKTAWYHSDKENDLHEVAWTTTECGEIGTQTVGQLKPNKWGLYDMHGNVWEWCANRVTGDPRETYSKDDWCVEPTHDRIMRGGYWFGSPGSVRSAIRVWDRPTTSEENIGFRVARAR